MILPASEAKLPVKRQMEEATPSTSGANTSVQPSRVAVTQSLPRFGWKRFACLTGLVAVVVFLAGLLGVLFVLPRDGERYFAVMGASPLALAMHNQVAEWSGGFLTGPRDLIAQRSADIAKLLEAHDAQLFERLLADPTFTRFENSRLFFRPLRRRVQDARQTSAADAFVWSMAEVVAQNETVPVDGAPSETRGQVGVHGTFGTDTVFIQSLKCVAPHSTITFDAYYYNPYGDVVSSTVLNIDHIPRPAFRLTIPCEHHVALLMCAGDAWEIACPPEMQTSAGGNPAHPYGWGSNSAQTQTNSRYEVVRFHVHDVYSPTAGNYTDVEEELAYRVLELGHATEGDSIDSEVPFRRMDIFRKLEKGPYKSVFLESPM